MFDLAKIADFLPKIDAFVKAALALIEAISKKQDKQQRQINKLLAHFNIPDTDGDGIPDHLDPTPNGEKKDSE